MAKVNLSGAEAAEAPPRYFHVDRRGVAEEHTGRNHMEPILKAFEGLGFTAAQVKGILDGVLILTGDGMPEPMAIELMVAAARHGSLKRSPVEMARHLVKLRKAVR